MAIDYDKEEKEFLDELNAGRFKIERIPNNAPDYQDFEDRDLAAFNEFLKTDSFKKLKKEATGE